MTTDVNTAEQRRLAELHACLTEEFAAQNARLRELTELTADTGDPRETHDRAALLAATRQNVERVGGALRRIAEGTYGRCERCGSAIPVERLAALPHARFCVPCQERHKG